MNAITWRKLGRIIAPEGAPAWRGSHSGMVSVLTWGQDVYRVFLTGRDEEGRFHIGCLDIDDSFNVVGEHPANPILSPGPAGGFDGGGVCMPWVVRVSESVLYMYYAGWAAGEPGRFRNECGMAISEDGGDTWRRRSEAPLLPLDDRDPIGTGTVAVLREPGDLWRMWYTTFREWRRLEDGSWRHYYHIKYAESEDGIVWRKPKDNLAIDFVDDREYAVGRPMVVREADGYRMWFCTRSVGATYRIGYAESADGLRWQRAPAGIGLSADGWDSEMIEYAYVLRRGDQYVMFYNGNGFGASGTGVAVGRVL